MANYNTLISAIQSVIAENGNNEITGNILQQTLVAMIGALGGGYQFAGIATPSTTPGTPDEKIFYLGSSGTYPNFGPAVIPSGNMGVFWYDTSWHVGTIEFPIGEGTITKSNLSQSLLNELLNGFVYAGIATPTGNPGNPLRDSFYMTTTPGTYTNYGNLTVQDEEIAVFRYVVSTGIWSKDSIALPETTEIVNNLYEGGVDKALSAEMGKVLAGQIEDCEKKIIEFIQPATNDLRVGSGARTGGWWYNESVQQKLRGQRIVAIKVKFSTTGTFTVIKSSKVLSKPTSAFTYDVVEQFSITQTDWQLLTFAVPFVLNDNEWLGVQPTGDTALSYYAYGGNVGMYFISSNNWTPSPNDLGFYIYVQNGYKKDIETNKILSRIGEGKRILNYSGLISNYSSGSISEADETYNGYLFPVEAGKNYIIDGFTPYTGSNKICIHCYSDYPVIGSSAFFLGEASYSRLGNKTFSIIPVTNTKYVLVSGTRAGNIEGDFGYYMPGTIAGDLFSDIFTKDWPPQNGYDNGQVDVNVNVANTINTANALQDAYTIGKDRYVLVLPINYKPYGKPTRLIIYGNPTNSYLTASNTSIPEGYPKIDVALADGYACLCCNGTPGVESGQGPNGTPLNVLSIIAAYKYVINKYNIARDGVFTCGYSQGSLNSFQIALNGKIPVLASVLISPDVDIWKIEYTAKDSTVRQYMLTQFNFEEKEANEIVKSLFPAYSSGGIVPAPTTFTGQKVAPNDAEKAYILNNVEKWVKYNPMTCGMNNADIARIYSIWGNVEINENPAEAALYDEVLLPLNFNFKLFVGTADEYAMNKYCKYFKRALNNAGYNCELRVFNGLNHSQVARSTTAVTYTGLLQTVSAKVTDVEGILFINRFNR